jgi:CheY-like chemotaxis protein
MGRQGRILIVDDLESWRKQLVEALQNEGYLADAAASVAEAADFLKKHLYHALVLDVRMVHSDPTNKEGIDLLRELNKQGLTKAIKIIIISAFGTKEQTRAAFKDFEVEDFLFKDDPFKKQDFLKAMQQVFATINLELDILWQRIEGPEQAILNLEIHGKLAKADPDLHQRMAAELEDLLCRLFYRAKKILVRPLTLGHSGMGVLRIQPSYTGGNGHEVVVKFGNAHAIKKEYRNFKEHVQPFLGGGRNTIALDFRRTPYLGGIIYSLLGTVNDQLVDFGDFYRNSDESRIKSTLDALFHDTCGVWYANCGNLEFLNLTEEYQRLLEYTPSMLDQSVFDQLSVQGKQRLSFVHLRSKRTFTNPLEVLAGMPFIHSTYRCITHGDFNQHNLLVDSNGHVWMIDFQGTGHSHILCDVAMLDSVVRFQLLRLEEATLRERLQMEEALCSIERFSQVEQMENKLSTTNRVLAKAYAIVVHLRTLAGKLMHQKPNDDMSEYYVALLYHALNTLRFSSLPVDQREHALLSASLIVDRLKPANAER